MHAHSSSMKARLRSFSRLTEELGECTGKILYEWEILPLSEVAELISWSNSVTCNLNCFFLSRETVTWQKIWSGDLKLYTNIIKRLKQIWVLNKQARGFWSCGRGFKKSKLLYSKLWLYYLLFKNLLSQMVFHMMKPITFY